MFINNRLQVKKEAFSIIELIFVIIILGIFTAIAIPKFSNTLNTTENEVLQINAKSVQAQINAIKNRCFILQKNRDSTFEFNGKIVSISGCIPTNLQEVLNTTELDNKAKTALLENYDINISNGGLYRK